MKRVPSLALTAALMAAQPAWERFAPVEQADRPVRKFTDRRKAEAEAKRQRKAAKRRQQQENGNG